MVLNHRYQLGKDYRLAMVPAGKLCRLPSINESATGPRGGQIEHRKSVGNLLVKKAASSRQRPDRPDRLRYSHRP